jgi:hypothetical protein
MSAQSQDGRVVKGENKFGLEDPVGDLADLRENPPSPLRSYGAAPACLMLHRGSRAEA